MIIENSYQLENKFYNLLFKINNIIIQMLIIITPFYFLLNAGKIYFLINSFDGDCVL
jgi:hypothetical protein